MIKPSGLIETYPAAQILGCTAKHVRSLIKLGKLEAFKPGKRKYVVSKESVLRLLEESRINPENYFK